MKEEEELKKRRMNYNKGEEMITEEDKLLSL